jgi:amidase
MRRRRVFSILAGVPAGMAMAKSKSFDPDRATATEAMRALTSRQISARELVAHLFARIKQHNPPINAFVTLAEEDARRQAQAADDARAGRRATGALAGLPVTVKDAFATAGLRTTAGSKSLANYVPTDDSAAVARLKRAGAIIIGKTNLPEWSADLQSFNEVVGVTNNPWDRARTPGGSTGGGAAAVAAGFTFGELGSDSGGSIRIPAHFAGVFGHKSTVHLVSRLGWIPPMPGQFRGPNDWSVAGPLARSADDLELLLRHLAGPPPDEAAAYQWTLPPARHTALATCRIGFVLDDPFCPVDSETLRVLGATIDLLRRSGAQLREGWPPGFDFARNQRTFFFLTQAFGGASVDRETMRRETSGPHAAFARDVLEAVDAPYREWEKRHVARLEFRQLWARYFREVDVFLSPVCITAAIRHDHSQPRHHRTVTTSSGNRPYGDLSPWISPAGLSGCPATIAPVGRTSQGLPVGVQIIGPYLEDATPIRIAALLGRFELAPPG